MAKVSRALYVLVLTCLLLFAMTGPAFAVVQEISPLACWNNCGSGGTGTKID